MECLPFLVIRLYPESLSGFPCFTTRFFLLDRLRLNSGQGLALLFWVGPRADDWTSVAFGLALAKTPSP